MALRYYVSYVYGGGQGTFGSIIIERNVPVCSSTHILEMMAEVMEERPNNHPGRPMILGFSKLEDAA